MYGEPRLLVLDEPNANLDEEGDAALAAVLAELKTRGVTVVIVSHRRGLISRLDRLAILRNGKIESFGPTQIGARTTRRVAASACLSHVRSAAGERMSAPFASGFAALLDSPPDESAHRFGRRAVFVPLGIAAALLALWAAVAPISGAVIAAARIKVELERKTVQHREGGIVRDIKVRNGQKVRAGDVLVIVDDVRSDAELSLLEDQYRAERVRQARVTAESTLARDFAHRHGARRRAAVSTSTWRASARNLQRTAGRSTNRSRRCSCSRAPRVRRCRRSRARSSRSANRAGSPPRSWRSTRNWWRRGTCRARACCRCSVPTLTTAAAWANRAASWRWRGQRAAELKARMADARNRYQPGGRR